MRFDYIEGGPGYRGPQSSSAHTLIMPVQDTPIRLTIDQDGYRENVVFKRDDIALAKAGSVTGWRWRDHAKVIRILIDPEGLAAFMRRDLKIELQRSRFEGQTLVHEPDLRSAAERMRSALVSPDIGSDVVFEALARVFLVRLVQRAAVVLRTYDARLQDFDVRKYARLIAFVEKNMSAKITVQDLASEIAMSRTALARKFKLKTGKTPMQFVTELRLETAEQLLSDGDLSLAEVSVACGFADQAHFSRCFKKVRGFSPGAFRKTLSLK
ncbi:helix-turn-helix domain-containing protein [Litoreibacter roseus]|nr:AraC family transcriptional regulator [Litoreibacter roseus]